MSYRLRAEWRPLLTALFFVAAAKIILLAFDSHMRLFMGDSATYLHSAVTGLTPADRSFTYPMLIAATSLWMQSITPLLLLQTLFGLIASMLVFGVLTRVFKVRNWLAIAAAVVLALEPSQLFYERMVMTETTGSLSLLACLAAALAYLQTRRLRWLLACVLLGTVLASLRVGLVPAALALAPIAVIVAALLPDSRQRQPARIWAAHLCVAIVATFAFHSAYRHWYGSRTSGEPAYIHEAGTFRLGLVVPLLKAHHFDGTGVDASILDEVTIPLADPFKREEHIWLPGGMLAVLHRHAGENSSSVAGVLADRAIADNPLAFVRLGLATMGGYFDRGRADFRLYSDLGYGQPPGENTLRLLREQFHYNAEGIARHRSLIYRYFESGAAWLVFCLFALVPAALAMLYLQRRQHAAPALLIALLAFGMVVGEVLCSHIISYRYLHPLPMLMLICLPVVLDRLLTRLATAEPEIDLALVQTVPVT